MKGGSKVKVKNARKNESDQAKREEKKITTDQSRLRKARKENHFRTKWILEKE